MATMRSERRGFYVSLFPSEDLRDLFLVILFLPGAARPRLLARAPSTFGNHRPVSLCAAAHFSILLAFFFVQRSFNYWLSAMPFCCTPTDVFGCATWTSAVAAGIVASWQRFRRAAIICLARHARGIRFQ